MRDSSVHVDDRLLKALGAVTVDFSMLEAAVQLAIGLLMMPDTADIDLGLTTAARNMIVTSEMSFKQRVHAFASLYRHRWPTQATKDFENLCGRLQDSENRRNQLVHSSYALDSATGRTVRRKATAKSKQGFRWHVETADAVEIDAFAESLRKMAAEVQRIVLIRMLPHEALGLSPG